MRGPRRWCGTSQAVSIAIGINWKGRRNILAVELASRESLSSWKELIAVCVSGRDTEWNSSSVTIMLASAAPFKKRYPRRYGSAATFTSCATRSIICRAKPTMIACRSCAGSMIGGTHKRRDRIFQPGREMGQTLAKLCAWVEENIEETLSFYRLPRQHHRNLKSTNTPQPVDGKKIKRWM